MKKSFFAQLAIVCIFAAAVFACFMGTSVTATAHLVFGLAAVVSSIGFVASLAVEANLFGLKA